MHKPADLLPGDLLAQATCPVLIHGKVAGTAWLVSDEGHLLMARHLLSEDKHCLGVSFDLQMVYRTGHMKVQ